LSGEAGHAVSYFIIITQASKVAVPIPADLEFKQEILEFLPVTLEVAVHLAVEGKEGLSLFIEYRSK
jgi:hypothetical protein